MKPVKKRVLIYGINYYPEMVGIGKYTSEMVDWMVNQGVECTVITAFPYYPYWQVQKPYKNTFYKKETSANGNLVIYRCPLYIPKNPTGIKRILHDASFSFTTAFVFKWLLFKKSYDHVISIAPPFHSGLLPLFYRLFKKTKIIYHIQDLQIDAAKELNMIKSDLLISFLMRIERFCIKRFDYVSSISAGMIDKIKLKHDRNIISFPNWVDTGKFYPLNNKACLKQEWGFDKDDHIILYSGNLGEKQGLDIIIDIANRLSADNKIRFIICGDGSYRTTLVNLVNDRQLKNVSFLPLQDHDKFNKFLNMADMHLILQKKDASDLVMPSKLTTILAVGGLVLATADKGTSLYNIIVENNIGLVAEPENPDSILKLINENLRSDNTAICNNAYNYALNNLSVDNVMSKFMADIGNN